MPKLNRYKKKTDPEPLEEINCQKAKNRIILAVKAIEGFVMFNYIAIGIVQMVSLLFSEKINKSFFRFLRTPSLKFVSEATVVCYIRKNIFAALAFNADLTILQIIRKKQLDTIMHQEMDVS